jgi:two-component system, chemotaxis family, protein-glutamate methylesterase/glutaminase
MIEVLLVDPYPTPRASLRRLLESDFTIHVIAETDNGEQGLRIAKSLQPGIVIVDVDDTRLNGLKVIRQMMSETPRPIVAITETPADQMERIHALAIESGALELTQRPHPAPGKERQAADFINLVRAMTDVKVIRRNWGLVKGNPTPVAQRNLFPPAGLSRVIKIVGIGISTGGPPALQYIFAGLPSNFGVPVVVVQHISRGFVNSLAGWLNDTTPLICKVAEHHEVLKPGTVYLAPDGYHLKVIRPGFVWLDSSPPLDGLQPSVNPLFQSLADGFGRDAVGMLMTGMGADGALGLKSMYDAGAHTIVQDEASSVIYGMPKEAVALNAACEVLNLKDIAARLKNLVHSGTGVK